MASVLQELQVKYKSREKTADSRGVETKVVYQGSKSLCEEAMDSQFMVNVIDAQLGSIEQVRLTQDEGPFWNLEVTYMIESPGLDSHLGGNGEAPGSSNGPSYSELTCRTISRDVSEHQNYRKNWNYSLWCTNPYVVSGNVHFPTNVWNNATAKNDLIMGTSYAYPGNVEVPSSYYYFAWGQSVGDLPALKGDYVWHECAKPTKPGVNSFTWPVYEMTEKSKHTSKEKAGWAVSKRAGRVVKPAKNDFGITEKFGGDWLCERWQCPKRGEILDCDLHLHLLT